ncbi:MAG: FAD-binding oxidoreductase [Candidatus Levybacteria bacterium]|nr:FAD-binding oxidoreductase [Candidatus Levybacteria bacterium]
MKTQNISTWQSDLNLKQMFPQLKIPLDVDVLIIGGGITGITSSYLLSKSGQRVALIEKEIIGKQSATGLTTAFITQVVDTDLLTLKNIFGIKTARLIWKSGEEAIDFIDKTVRSEEIECEFTRCFNYYYANNQKDASHLQKENSLAEEIGFPTKFTDNNNLKFFNYGYMQIKNQAKFHPLKYIRKLAKIANKNGVLFFENTLAIKVKEKNLITVKTKFTDITARKVIIATHSPFHHPLQMYFKAGLYITYIIEAIIPKGILREAIYEDLDSPYHYFRIDPQNEYDRIIIGGEDHREDLPISSRKNFKALENYMKKILPNVKYKITRRWSGPILEPLDGLPYIGKYSKDSNQLVTHGYSGNGITYGTISALIFNDIINGKKNPYEKVYDASRMPSIKQMYVKGIDYAQILLGGILKNTLKF